MHAFFSKHGSKIREQRPFSVEIGDQLDGDGFSWILSGAADARGWKIGAWYGAYMRYTLR